MEIIKTAKKIKNLILPKPPKPDPYYASEKSLLKSSGKMTPEELFEFDLNGFLIIRNAISKETVAKMNAILNEHQKDEFIKEFSFLKLDSIFLDLVTHPKVMDICEELLGDWFRFEQGIGIQEMPPNVGREVKPNLHGGHMVHQGSFQYQWNRGRPHCGMLVFGFSMNKVNEGEGGLVVVPGSHKLNLPISGHDVWRDFAKGHLNHRWIQNPPMEEGDLVVFTEALIHGTQAWEPKDRGRRTLYYRYCPGYMAWRRYDELEQYAKLARNDLERRLFDGPYVGAHNDEEKPRWVTHYKKFTREQPKQD